MKKHLFFSVMALSATAALAQVQLPNPTHVEMPALMTNVVNKGNLNDPYVPVSRQAKAPMVNYEIYAENGDGVYYCGINDEFGAYSISLALGSISAPSYFSSYYRGTDEQPTFTWQYTTSSGTYPMEIEHGQGKLQVVGSVEYPLLTGTLQGQTLEFDRGNSPYTVTTGAYYQTLANQEYPLSMLDPSIMGSYYASWNEESGARRFSSGYGISEAIQVFNKTSSPLVVYGAQLPVFVGINTGSYFNNGSSMTMELWTCDYDLSTYQLQLRELLGTTTADADNVPFYQADSQNAILAFDFETTDEFGMPVAQPVVVPSNSYFALVFKGFDNPDADVAISFAPSYNTSNTSLSDPFMVPGYLFFKETDDDTILFPFQKDGATFPQLNFLVSLDADYLGASWGFSEMEAPTSGGYLETEAEMVDGTTGTIQYNVVYTSVPVQSLTTGEVNFEVETPDWVTVESLSPMNNSAWNSAEGMGYIGTFVATALPSGETGRSGYITIRFPRTGQSWGIKVGQGEWDPDSMPSGVETAQAEATKAYVAGEELHLAYGEGFDRADVYNVSGVRVASYSLPAGGQYVAPVSGLADGVYVVVLGGEKTETLKFVK